MGISTSATIFSELRTLLLHSMGWNYCADRSFSQKPEVVSATHNRSRGAFLFLAATAYPSFGSHIEAMAKTKCWRSSPWRLLIRTLSSSRPARSTDAATPHQDSCRQHLWACLVKSPVMFDTSPAGDPLLPHYRRSGYRAFPVGPLGDLVC